MIACLVIAAILAAAAVYPFVVYPAVLRALPAVPPVSCGGARSAEGAEFCLVFSAYNESRSLVDKLENLEQLVDRYPLLEVRAYDDGSSDGTLDMLCASAALASVTSGEGRRGKAHGMKEIVSLTSRPIVVCTDANVLLDGEIFDELAALFSEEAVGGVCGHLEYLASSGSATEAVGGLYWRLEERIKSLESSSGNVMGGDGSIFAVRRELYPEFPDSVQDDFFVTMSVVFSGRRLVYAPSVRAYERLVSASSDEFARKIRIAARAYHTYRSFRSSVRSMSRFDRWKFYSHKLLRWWSGALICASALLVAAAIAPHSWFVAVALLIFGGVLLAPSGRWVPRHVRAVSEMLRSLVASSFGSLKAAFGATYVTWSPPTSR